MKTTVELPDELMVEVKKTAAERRTTVRALVERGLRRELADPGPDLDPHQGIEWVTVDGGLPPGVDMADRESLHDWLMHERRR